MSEHPQPGDGYWYLGGPYSDDMERRYKEHFNTASLLLKSNVTVYSPIVHCHNITQYYSLPTDAGYWEHHNFNIILPSNGMILLTLDNWQSSKGLKAEILFCQMKNKPIWGLKPPTDLTFEWTRLF